MPAYLPLSVVIISLNEERRIGGCIASVRDLTDDIVVVDAHSTDRTLAVAIAGGARTCTRVWTGYADQKAHGNQLARHDWILSLDADERVTSALAECLRAEFAREPCYDAYDLPFQNYFGASPVRFGAWNPESHVRLFDRRKFQWSCDEVHEGLRGVEGVRIGRLGGAITHHSVESRAQLAAKTQRYSALFAGKLRRQHRQPSWWKVWLNPAFRFARDYLFRGGLLDGRVGLVIAWESARYTHLKYWLALPEPVRRGGSISAHWAMGASAVAMLLLVATASVGVRPVSHESRWKIETAPGPATVSEGNDGYDNNPMVPSNRSMTDDDVLT